MTQRKCVCPLLRDPANYNPHYRVFQSNPEDKKFILNYALSILKTGTSKAPSLNPDIPDAAIRAENCRKDFEKYMQEVLEDPKVLESLGPLDFFEKVDDIYRERGFKDVWLQQKQKETDLALRALKKRLDQVDSIQDFSEKWCELAKGLAAGNVFDWGSKEVHGIIDVGEQISLYHAIEAMEERPWFLDGVDAFTKRIKERPYKNVVIFTDNAGVDFVLGVLPFARQLLLQNSNVILCSNSLPSVNDMTFRELPEYTGKAAEHCPILAKAIAERRLTFAENGQKGPAMDLRNLTPETCRLMETADLVVIVGMARSVVTNFDAKFKVDSLKVSVQKIPYVAERLGAKHMAVIFNYETAS